MFEYRVVVQKYKTMMGGRFDHDDFEALLNDQALEGWEFDRFLDPEITAIMENEKAVHLLLFRRRRSE